MITYAKMTGKTIGRTIEVTMVTRERIYIEMQISNLNVSLPSDKWIEDNKDNFLAIVFTGGGHEVKHIIGFHPVKGADSSVYNTHERLLTTTKDLVTVLKEDLVGTLKGDLLNVLKNDLVSSSLKSLTTVGSATTQTISPASIAKLVVVETGLDNVGTKLGDVDEKLGKIIESLDEIKELIREIKL